MLYTLYFTVMGLAIAAGSMQFYRDKLFEVSRAHFRWQEIMIKVRIYTSTFLYFLFLSLVIALFYLFWRTHVPTS